jgi:hypothetical protein
MWKYGVIIKRIDRSTLDALPGRVGVPAGPAEAGVRLTRDVEVLERVVAMSKLSPVDALRIYWMSCHCAIMW